MKKLFILSLSFFMTISLLTACGEKGTGNATEEVTKECCDSTKNCTTNVVDTLKK
jgi:hypothetical protein